MKKLSLSMVVVVITSLLFTSCRKDDKITKVEDTFDGILTSNQSKEQFFTVNAGTGGVVQGTSGAKITFPPNFARNADGSAFTGDATVVLRESYKKSQWLADGLSTATTNGLLLSGGMIDLNVMRKDNGGILVPALAMAIPAPNPNDLTGKIAVEIPKPTNATLLTNQQLFLPDSAASAANTGATVPAWVQASGTAQGGMPFTTTATSYKFQLPKFRWVNCDQLYDIPGGKTTIIVRPTLPAGATNTKVYFVYSGNNRMVVNIPLLQAGGSLFRSYINSIPLATPCDIVVISKAADGTILFKAMPVTSFTVDQTIDITPEKAPGASVQAYLDSKN